MLGFPNTGSRSLIGRSCLLLLLASVFVLAGCRHDPVEGPIDELVYDGTPYALSYGQFPEPPIALDNALTEQGVKLGRMLFYETDLSLDGSMSCASCHRQQHAFSDSLQFSIGVHGLPGGRQAMGIFNMAWNTNNFFWDGRSPLLRDQSLKPIQDSLEMAETLDNVVAKLNADQTYPDQFMRAFGSEEITPYKMSLALEQFMNSIVSVDSRYDRYLAGSIALDESEERGRELFFAEYNPFFPDDSGADCAHCHTPRNFENDLYINNGLESDASVTDYGRELVTNDPADRGKMKVPSLRNVALTAPYMHDGRFQTLEEVVEHYDSGLEASATLDPALEHTRATGLMLTAQDKLDLIAFLRTLTDETLPSRAEYGDPH